MQLKKLEEGHWVSDDAMQLHFFARTPPEQPAGQAPGPPTAFKAERVGHDGCYDPYAPVDVPVKNLQLLAAVNFGEARLCWPGNETRWSGDSFRYGLYRVMKEVGQPDGRRVLLVEVNGAGMFFYQWQQADSLRLWESLVAALPEPRTFRRLIRPATMSWCSRSRSRLPPFCQVPTSPWMRSQSRGKDAWEVAASPHEEPVA